jgi:hypothetical protein
MHDDDERRMSVAADGASGAAGERAARRRLEDLFRAFDRLTPDELARTSCRLAPDEVRGPLLDAVDEAAIRTGRVALMDEVRDSVVEAVLARYSAGSFHPTFAGLNWGLSQGTVEDRVAISEALADAASVAVVEDALDPEIAAALTREAAAIMDLAAGEASEGSLAQAIRDPDDPELRPGLGARNRRLIVAVAIVSVVIATLAGAGAGG